jgi:hypothetical protein
MTDTPYFDAYERRRLRRANNSRNRPYTDYGTSDIRSSGQVLQSTGNEFIWNVPANQPPEYRLRKTYTFIGEVRVLSDCVLESRKSIEDEWAEVSETFNSYVY